MADRPNIVFFFTDDQRFDTIHALGNERIDTPNMDRLVRDGVAFTRCHIPGGTVGAVCMPSRAMLHSGRTLFHLENSGESIPEQHALMGETFRRNGYATFGTGKWHNGPESFSRSFEHGDEIFFGGMADHWNVPAYHFDASGKYDGQLPYVRDAFTSNHVEYRRCDHVHAGRHSTELFADTAIGFLEAYHSPKPYFMYISFMAPHDPRTMPERFLNMYRAEDIVLPPSFSGGHPFDNGALHIRDEELAAFPRNPTEIRRHIAEYYAMISHLDHNIGRVIEAVERRGELENTIFLLAGDNGLAIGRHGLMGKQNLYDHSVRVPLVVGGPGIARNRRTDAGVYLLDIFPTLCEKLDIPRPETVDGESFAKQLDPPEFGAPGASGSHGPSGSHAGSGASGREDLFLAYAQFQRGISRDGFKLIEYRVDGVSNTQLFDLSNDPWETNNLAHSPEHAGRLENLRRLLRARAEEWDDLGSKWGGEFWGA